MLQRRVPVSRFFAAAQSGSNAANTSASLSAAIATQPRRHSLFGRLSSRPSGAQHQGQHSRANVLQPTFVSAHAREKAMKQVGARCSLCQSAGAE